MPNTSTKMIRAATTALPSWNAPLLDLCLLLWLRPTAWPFRRTPLALHCTDGSSREASPIPLGGGLPQFPRCRDTLFSETHIQHPALPKAGPLWISTVPQAHRLWPPRTALPYFFVFKWAYIENKSYS